MTSLIAFHQKSAIFEGNVCTVLLLKHCIMVLTCLRRGLQETWGTGKSFFLQYTGCYRAPWRKTFELSSKRHQEWIARINRKDWVPSKYARVCSDHFVAGIICDD